LVAGGVVDFFFFFFFFFVFVFVFVFVCFFFFAAPFCLVLVEGVLPWLEDCSGDVELGRGVVLDDVVVVVVVVAGPVLGEGDAEVEVEVVVVVDEDDELDEEAEELDEPGDVVVMIVVVVVDGADEVEDVDVVEEVDAVEEVDEDEDVVCTSQVIVSVMIPGGVGLSLGMTPGVASTGSAFTRPPANVSLSVHGSAEAIGMAATPRTTEIAAASSSTARSLRLVVKLVRPVLPTSACPCHTSQSQQSVGSRSRY
jgi:hypothetical protein